MYQVFLAFLLLCVNQAIANTETIVFTVPKFYEVPLCLRSFLPTPLREVNASTLLLTEYPIQSIRDYSLKETLVSVPYDFVNKPQRTLFVKLNNYEDSTFDSNDLINVKVCWPATFPIDFSLDQVYIKASEFDEVENDTFDIYIKIDLQGDFYAVKEVEEDAVDFHLVISKLPGPIPIPIELYEFIMYLVDLLILLAGTFPYLLMGLEHFTGSTKVH
ncbi:hypothetical protein C7M61_002496 [Candidozyma pseudohaemuli]|uniref:Uncharacterized protein n=1 Tax=Candidozyma pseudohaemuli TaxID=418784 RepID=A0A2P7YRH2_9ASCO|nr:hypothetical protein C7M61_002496 [[Candida] pseudohaemulonii]PSK38563.1 hypothetical protein C7M61_002496 [[Candida] pseudohaemulonii]